MARTKPNLTPPTTADLWRRWNRGDTLLTISKAMDLSITGVHKCVVRGGGIAPRRGKRNPASLTDAERETISRRLSQRWSLRRIAIELSRAPSTISREVKRNGGTDGYRCVKAELRAWRLGRRPKPCKLATRPRLRECVSSKLKQNWSPEQISGWLRQNFVDDASMQVSHETIYRSLFVQARNALKKELIGHLRTHRKHRQPKTSKRGHSSPIVDGVSIRERPAEVEDRAVPGHWEGDLLFGSAHNYIATLVERQTRFVMLIKIPSKDTATVTAALQRHITKLPLELRLSLTWDRGSELSGHKQFVVDTGVPVYFCDPHSPWQRGSNENTNGLLRQYFPKGKDIGHFSQAELNKVARQLNRRPRKTLDFRSPAEALEKALR